MDEITIDQRRAMLGPRHALSDLAPDPVEAARRVVALHATDPATVFMSVWARVAGVTRTDIEDHFYERRSIVRVMGMRRTWFAAPPETVTIIQAAAGRGVGARERKRIEKAVAERGLASDPARYLRQLEDATLEALERRGEALTAELAEDVPGMADKIVLGSGRWATEVAMSTRIVLLLAMDGRIARARPRGTWLSSQFRWAALDRWMPGAGPLPPPEQARSELVRLYLSRFGPATETDVVWWTGWNKRDTRAAIDAAGTRPVGLDGAVGYMLADDPGIEAGVEPWVALLPALDPTIMGWKERAWYLGPHEPGLFDSAGNAGPTIWVGGRVVGVWGQDGDGAVVCRLMERVESGAADLIAQKAAQLSEWVDRRVILPRFTSPLHKELVAGR